MQKIFSYLHPFLLVLVALVFAYFKSIWETAPWEILRPFFFLSLLLLVLHPVAAKFAASREWGGILTSIFVLGVFFQPQHFVVVSVSMASVLLTVALLHRLRRRPFEITDASRLLSVTALFILLVQILFLLPYFASMPASYYRAMSARLRGEHVIPLRVDGVRPDIYYIILDAYPRTDMLRDLYHYDNSPFVRSLEALGFVLPAETRANYPRTALSISSTLDMQYWDTIAPGMEEVIFWWPVQPVMQHSRVGESLAAIGYKNIWFASDWDLTNFPGADVYIKPYPAFLTGYENYLLATTPLQSLALPLQGFAPPLSNEVHRRYITNILDNLASVPDIDGAKFVFAHIILPHPPFVFHADGSAKDTGEAFTFAAAQGIEEERLGYVGQIEFLNSRLPKILERILEQSETPPIIILQADHGPSVYYSFQSPDANCLPERFSIFGAYYLPGLPGDVLPEDLTPVNLFRIIFNRYFGTQLPLLENRHYFTFGHNLFKGMQDVTGRVNEACTIPVR